MKTNDGTPDAVKVARPVWSGGKGGDNIKALPITIGGRVIFAITVLLCLDGRAACKEELPNGIKTFVRGRSKRAGQTVETGYSDEILGRNSSTWFQPSGNQTV